MIVIKHIDFLEVQGERYEFRHRYISGNNLLMEVGTANGTAEALVEEVRELIVGREFRDPSGRTVVVGVSKQAQDIIGIQYEAWENQSKMIEDLILECSAIQIKVEQKEKELSKIKSASFWDRLKWMFFEVIMGVHPSEIQKEEPEHKLDYTLPIARTGE